MPAPFAFDASTPADAQMKPWRVSVMSSGGRTRTTSTLSCRIASTWRGSRSSASSSARSDGSISSSRTTRPSAFETTFWATTTTSASSSPPAVGCVGEQRHEVVSFLDLRDALERDDPDLAVNGGR